MDDRTGKPTTEQSKILISDDVNLFLEMQGFLFQRHNIEVLVAENGEEAMEMIAGEKPGLIILDLHSPKVAGDVCCRRVKSDPVHRDIPFVLMANAQWEEEVRRCREAGCDEIIYKPLNRDHLLKTVCEYLGIANRRARRTKTFLAAFYGPVAGENLSGTCRDLSLGGVFVESAAHVHLGDVVRMLLQLPGQEEAVRCVGRVAWINAPDRPSKADFPPGFGVQFTETSARGRKAMGLYLERLRRREGEE